nr:hypothetical protein [Tanacetum cinerariifolium]
MPCRGGCGGGVSVVWGGGGVGSGVGWGVEPAAVGQRRWCCDCGEVILVRDSFERVNGRFKWRGVSVVVAATGCRRPSCGVWRGVSVVVAATGCRRPSCGVWRGVSVVVAATGCRRPS